MKKTLHAGDGVRLSRPAADAGGRKGRPDHRSAGGGRRAANGPGAAVIDAMVRRLAAGDIPGAEASARDLVREFPGHWAGWKMLGVVMLQSGRPADAVPALQRAQALAPTDAETCNNLGIALVAAGRPDEAEAACRRAVALNPGYAQAHCNLGVALQALQELPAAEAAYRRALALQPGYARAISNLGAVLVELGRFADAEALLRQGGGAGDGDADATRNLAAALEGSGRPDEAEGLLRRAISRDSADAANRRALAGLLLRREDRDGAEQNLHQAIALEPACGEGYALLGALQLAQHRPDAAEISLRRALELDPGNAEALGCFGECLKRLERNEEAEHALRGALARRPGTVAWQNSLATVLLRLGRQDEAAGLASQAARAAHDSAQIQLNYGFTLKALDRVDEARGAFEQAVALGSDEARIALSALMPAIISSRDEILAVRARISAALDVLAAEPPRFEDPQDLMQSPNFFLAYHGLNDRELQTRTAGMYLAACPALHWTAAHCSPGAPRRSGKLRVGFFSRYLHQHSVSACFSRLVEGISQADGFDVALVSHRAIDAQVYSTFRGRFIQVSPVIESARRQIAELELDVLIYLDIGMEPVSYFLAFSRLAPLQCVLAGHPVTTGIPAIDCYLSTAAFEPADAQAHYSEELVLLPHPPAIFAPPAVPDVLKTRGELGLPEEGRLYVCPMKLQKLHPDFDAALARILALDPGGKVILFEDYARTAWKGLVLDRLARTLPADALQRVCFMPWLRDYRDFVCAVVHADVLLDPFHFGIGSTVVVLGVTGTPQVTLPGEFMRGRVGAWYNRLLGIPECTVADVESYAATAVAIATDPGLRARLVRNILGNGRRLFFDLSPVTELTAFLRARTGIAA